ncbi:MAG: hypothetical protein JWR47_1159 [Phenylobacterium sp.]|nr:hypothetical protein [Phenylobacterium sp.]MDB5464948.1 hypothetical protein [Phenylobacterium sp.]
MRALILLLALGAAAPAAVPAAAQAYRGLALSQDASRIADQQAARSRDIAITNDLSTLQARVQTDQGLSDLAALRAPPAVLPAGAAPPMIDTSKLASIPDAELAASNARIRAAADNRR